MTAPDPLEALAHALLYEGFALYPYRASALKNRQRWFFGGAWPPSWQAAHPEDPALLGAQLLLEGTPQTRISAEARFLQWCGEDAQERRLPLGDVALAQALAGPAEARASWAPGLRTCLRLGAAPAGPAFRIDLSVVNESAMPATANREAVLPLAMASLHVVLRARDGHWVSLLDPPDALAAEARDCRREGLFPVLAGAPGARDTALASPMALPDHPCVAPESPGDLFDGTEIDEMLSLRVLTLSEAERRELEAAPARVRELLHRVDSTGCARLGALHGALRERRMDAAAPAAGARVRLRPRRGGDVLDLALAGRVATVTAVERDVDGGVHVAVVLEDDPGADLGAAGFHGHRFFFTPAEVEPL